MVASSYLLVNVKLAENLGGVEEMGVVDNPKVASQQTVNGMRREQSSSLLDVPSKQRQVENQRQPVSVNEE